MENDNTTLKKAHAILQAIRYMESIDTEAAFNRDIHKIKKARKALVYNRLVRFAACLSIPLFIATAVMTALYFFPQESHEMAEVTAPCGSVVRYELPDKSTVWINSGSTLKYPTRFDRKARRVEIDGEAYFEVHANPDKPFYVNAFDGLSVKVYGTRFNVSAYSDDENITTTLENGHVDVIVSDQTLSLIPGEQASYSKLTGEIVRSQVNTYEHTAWKDGRLVLRNASLNQVFKALERKFGVTVSVKGTVNESETYRATFRNESLSQILDYLSRTASFSWRFEDTRLPNGEVLPGKTVCVDLK
ncbi:MAG: FecR family protein [Candidatus Cryptobacteroides sp.]